MGGGGGLLGHIFITDVAHFHSVRCRDPRNVPVKTPVRLIEAILALMLSLFNSECQKLLTLTVTNVINAQGRLHADMAKDPGIKPQKGWFIVSPVQLRCSNQTLDWKWNQTGPVSCYLYCRKIKEHCGYCMHGSGLQPSFPGTDYILFSQKPAWKLPCVYCVYVAAGRNGFMCKAVGRPSERLHDG